MDSIKQLAARAELEIDRLTQSTWNEKTVKDILRRYPKPAVTRIMCDHMKFGQMFGAGRQLARWCGEVCDEITCKDRVLTTDLHSPDKESFGRHSVHLVRSSLSGEAIAVWLRPMPLISRSAFLRRYKVPEKIIRQVEEMWQEWRLLV